VLPSVSAHIVTATFRVGMFRYDIIRPYVEVAVGVSQKTASGVKKQFAPIRSYHTVNEKL
jgi:hypothetical protein